MSDEIREGESKQTKPRKRAASDSESGDTNIKKPGNTLLWVLLGVGGLLLCGLLVGGVGILGAALWFTPVQMEAKGPVAVEIVKQPMVGGEKPVNEKPELPKGDAKKPPPDKPAPAEIGKAAWGTAPVAELDPERAIWDFTVRLPKGYDVIMEDKQIRPAPETRIYQWQQKGGKNHIDISKVRMAGIDPVVLFKQDPMKSDPKDPEMFEVYRGPQEVLINNMRGVRQWRWSTTKGLPGGAVRVSYRYEVAGWHYVLNATALGNSREEAEKTASSMDVSLCTFRKR